MQCKTKLDKQSDQGQHCVPFMICLNLLIFFCNPFCSHNQGVQRRMISVDNFFVFLRLLFFALLLLYVT